LLQGLFSAVSVKVVMLISVSILIVVAIPATVAATARPHEDAEAADSSRIVDPERRDLLILTSRQQHERLIEELQSQQFSCDSQVGQLVSAAHLGDDRAQPITSRAHSEMVATILPLVQRIRADEDELERQPVVTTSTVTVHINVIVSIRVTTIGDDGHPGTVVVLCQNILVEVREEIVVIVTPPPPGPESDDEDD